MNIEFYADIDKDIPDEVIQNVISYMGNVFNTDVRCFIENETVYRGRPTLTFTCNPFSTAEDEEEIPF